jgi:hypothetical protein
MLFKNAFCLVFFHQSDKQLAILSPLEMEFGSLGDREVLETHEEIVAKAFYEESIYECIIIQCADCADDMTETLVKLRSLRKVKNIQVSSMLRMIPRLKARNKRTTVCPVTVSSFISYGMKSGTIE